MSARVLSVNVSEEKGTLKKPVTEAVMDELGIQGDAHAGEWHRQVSILSRELIDVFQSEMDRGLENGEFAENITTSGLDLVSVGLMDRLKIGDAELLVTQVGKECHGDACSIHREVGKCVMPKEGVFCKVLKGGTVMPDMEMEHLPRTLNIKLITVSDRASSGEYEDKSGPEIESILNDFFNDKRWHPDIARCIVPDDEQAITAELELFDGDVVILTGGTGIGPRDVTPEVVMQFCDRLIPGIMDAIRVNYGAEHPNALLSRSVAGARETMLVYALPGSVRAVKEYMAEILKTLEHALMMVHGIGGH